MSYTRAQLENDLVSRAGLKMAAVGFAVTYVGTNADLNNPLTVALRKMGKTVSNPVVDGDLSSLTDAEVDELTDRAELRLLQNIAGNIDKVDIRVGQRNESLGQMATQIEKAIDRLERNIRSEYGAGLQALQAGSLILDSQETLDESAE